MNLHNRSDRGQHYAHRTEICVRQSPLSLPTWVGITNRYERGSRVCLPVSLQKDPKNTLYRSNRVKGPSSPIRPFQNL